MAFKVVFCAAVLTFVDLQVVSSDSNNDANKANIVSSFNKVHDEINQQIRDIMSRILFIRDSEISENKIKLSSGVSEEISSLNDALNQIKSDHGGDANECLADLARKTDYSKAIADAGNGYFETCVSNYPPGGSVNMDINDVTSNFDELASNTDVKLKKCASENGLQSDDSESCLKELNETFQRELLQLKESRLKHMEAEAKEAEILERVKIDACMKEALTNARVKKDGFRDGAQACVAEPAKIDPSVNLALPRE